MSWTPRYGSGGGKEITGWVAELAPGVELLRVPGAPGYEHVYLRIDGRTVPYLNANIPELMRDEWLERLVRHLRRVGEAGARLAQAELRTEDDKDEPQMELL